MIKKLAIVIVLVVITVCTISDIYYKKLRRDYPVLKDDLPVEGIISDYRIHWGHAYITLNTSKKVHLYPTENYGYDTIPFNDLIEVGDTISKIEDSDEIVLKKKGRAFRFVHRLNFR